MSATEPLPAPVAAYFAANPGFDVAAMLAPFAADAVVSDERRRHVGTEAIRAWIEEATVGNRAVFTPEAWHEAGGRLVVQGTVAGAFPGSPVRLAFCFALADGQIAALDIS
jgi:hypothetical protein